MISNWTAENIPDLTGKIAIVTGANCGIGYEMARALARKKARVILACRNQDKGEAAVRQITQEHPSAKAELIQLDLSNLASVFWQNRLRSSKWREGLRPAKGIRTE
jgi:NAD(P)-dependent dehydrogenase (short-subunit alcohol dehydrogenase family)